MNWKVIKTEEEYNRAIARVEALFDFQPGSPEFEELELLALLVKDYEDKYFPMPFPDPIEMVKMRMEEKGLKNRDLVGIIGSESHVSSVLKGRRQITLDMARALSHMLNIPATIFINDSVGFEKYDTGDYFLEALKDQIETIRMKYHNLTSISSKLNAGKHPFMALDPGDAQDMVVLDSSGNQLREPEPTRYAGKPRALAAKPESVIKKK